MNNAGKNQQIEFEVFPKENKSNYSYLSGVSSGEPHDPAQINVVFSHQSVIVIFICTIMLLVAAFTLGVEKGKLVARNTQSVVPAAAGTAAAVAAPVTAQAVPAATNPVKAEPMIAKTGAQSQTAQTTPVAAGSDSPKATGGYAIQIASVKSESAAKKLAETLTKKGISAFTRSAGSYIVVLAGNFGKREEAQASLRELKKTYTDCFIRKI